jgi:hypothetical protein
MPPSLVEGATDSDFVVAVWDDGHAKTMHNMTSGQLRLQLEGRAARDSSEVPLWTEEMADGKGNTVTMRQRADRKIHNVAVGRFDTLEPPQPRILPSGTPTVQRALAFKLPRVQRYISERYDSAKTCRTSLACLRRHASTTRSTEQWALGHQGRAS